MKFIFLSLSFLISTISFSQNLDYLEKDSFEIIRNVSYGTHERNLFDIILPQTKNPTGLAIFIHGGGFTRGSKKKLYSKRSKDIAYFIKHDIAVATINYRYSKKNDSLGVKACINDAIKAIQFIKHNAAAYNINKDKVACYGESAGAGISLYLALHDDLAITNKTGVSSESTRLACAGAIATQGTYDVFQWEDYIPYLSFFMLIKQDMFEEMGANFYGFVNYESFKPYEREVRKSLDMLAMVDSNDPQIYLENLLVDTFPKNNYIIQHHKNHAITMSEKLNEHGVVNYIFTADNKKERDAYPVYVFITEQLNK